MYFSHSPYSSENQEVDDNQKGEANHVVQSYHNAVTCNKPPQSMQVQGRRLHVYYIMLKTHNINACTTKFPVCHPYIETDKRGSPFIFQGIGCGCEQ